jgi:hypothetical protein
MNNLPSLNEALKQTFIQWNEYIIISSFNSLLTAEILRFFAPFAGPRRSSLEEPHDLNI